MRGEGKFRDELGSRASVVVAEMPVRQHRCVVIDLGTAGQQRGGGGHCDIGVAPGFGTVPGVHHDGFERSFAKSAGRQGLNPGEGGGAVLIGEGPPDARGGGGHIFFGGLRFGEGDGGFGAGVVVAGDGFDAEAPDLFLGVFECVEEFGGVWTGLEPESIYRISRDLADERIPLFSDLNVGGGGIAFWVGVDDFSSGCADFGECEGWICCGGFCGERAEDFRDFPLFRVGDVFKECGLRVDGANRVCEGAAGSHKARLFDVGEVDVQVLGQVGHRLDRIGCVAGEEHTEARFHDLGRFAVRPEFDGSRWVCGGEALSEQGCCEERPVGSSGEGGEEFFENRCGEIRCELREE